MPFKPFGKKKINKKATSKTVVSKKITAKKAIAKVGPKHAPMKQAAMKATSGGRLQGYGKKLPTKGLMKKQIQKVGKSGGDMTHRNNIGRFA